jgi:hypothetical protein
MCIWLEYHEVCDVKKNGEMESFNVSPVVYSGRSKLTAKIHILSYSQNGTALQHWWCAIWHCASYIFSYFSEAILMAFGQKRCTTVILLQSKTQQCQPPNYIMLKSTQHVSAAMGHHQAKLEQSLGILCVRTVWDIVCAHFMGYCVCTLYGIPYRLHY